VSGLRKSRRLLFCPDQSRLLSRTSTGCVHIWGAKRSVSSKPRLIPLPRNKADLRLPLRWFCKFKQGDWKVTLAWFQLDSRRSRIPISLPLIDSTIFTYIVVESCALSRTCTGIGFSSAAEFGSLGAITDWFRDQRNREPGLGSNKEKFLTSRTGRLSGDVRRSCGHSCSGD
jgi:hypothetical protein